MGERFPSPASSENKEGAKDTLRWVAKKISDEEGMTRIEKYLLGDEIEKAKEYLLGTADALFELGKLNFDQAAEVYNLIGVSIERAADLRQKNLKQTISDN